MAGRILALLLMVVQNKESTQLDSQTSDAVLKPGS